MYSTRAFWKKRTMKCKFDHCVSPKDVTSCRDIVSQTPVVSMTTRFIIDVAIVKAQCEEALTKCDMFYMLHVMLNVPVRGSS